MKRSLLILSALVLTGCIEDKSVETQLSSRLQEAKAKAMVLCAGCHGPKGIGTADFNPNLACQKKLYMVKQLGFYRDGTRTTHPPMTNIARMLTEDEVDAISEWYSLTGCPISQKTLPH
ncbi:hypothetical protein ACH42_08825 [Endozoicomonas sp. (ex Bugula neritina AB1)]|nr:hypothetical protein ACH42_08825 [Endozoicomonas sp. (ex Bugula neritina AB1)]